MTEPWKAEMPEVFTLRDTTQDIDQRVCMAPVVRKLVLRADHELCTLREALAEAERKNKEALELAERYAGIDGAHHKQWCISEMVRSLTGEGYDAWVASYCAGDDGPDTYSWDEGTAP